MTARQGIANYESKVREYTNFAIRGIKKVCKECGPREAGGEAEHKAQRMMAKDLEDCCEEVRIEEYRLSPRAFMGWVHVSVVLGILAAAAYNLGQALVSLLLMLIPVFLIVVQFLMYKIVLAPFYPKKTSHNVIGVRKPSGEIKRRIIFAGHADSAPEWRYTYYGHKFFKSTRLLHVVIFFSVGTIFLGLGFSIAAVAMGEAFRAVGDLAARGGLINTLGYIMIGLCLPMVAAFFFHNNKRFVMGANDNLTGCYTSMAIAKLLGGTNTRLENTELVVACVGGEEAGLRGAKAFCKAHAEEFKDVETVFIALDTMTEYDHMAIYLSDLTNTIKHDPAVAAMMRQGAKNAGYDVPFMLVPFGASDAAAAKQAGIRSAAFVAMTHTPPPYYHTRLDTVDVLEPKTVEACLDIVTEMAFQFDETGLAPFEGVQVKPG